MNLCINDKLTFSLTVNTYFSQKNQAISISCPILRNSPNCKNYNLLKYRKTTIKLLFMKKMTGSEIETLEKLPKLPNFKVKDLLEEEQ